jgi:transcriptional regulator with XRE-family HTH domain
VTRDTDLAGLGRWLRAERQARGWDVPKMARQLAHAAGDERHNLPSKECLLVYVRRWEHGTCGPSERYRMYFCRAFGIGLQEFGPAAAAGAGPGGATAPLADGAGPGGATMPLADGAGPEGAAAPLAGEAPPGEVLRAVRDSFAEDAKTCQARAEQATGPVRAALWRGQALAYTAAAEHLAAALGGNR